jgi:hypothetical protein
MPLQGDGLRDHKFIVPLVFGYALKIGQFNSKAMVSDDILGKIIGIIVKMSVQNYVLRWTTSGVVVTLLLCLTAVPVRASPGTEVFQGFTQHISEQIGRDKQAFAQADTCTAWFYKQLGKKPPPVAEAEKIHFMPISQSETDIDCAKRYPNGLEAAREAFGQTQQRLSFSLTFFQMALVSDGDDDHAYSTREMQDVLDAFGRTYRSGQSVDQYVSQLIGLFDRHRLEVQFPVLMTSMQTLMDKGYRLTKADQTALNLELE